MGPLLSFLRFGEFFLHGPLGHFPLYPSRIHARTSCRSAPTLYPGAGMGWDTDADAVLSSANPVAL
jgi:hypothetical protein